MEVFRVMAVTADQACLNFGIMPFPSVTALASVIDGSADSCLRRNASESLGELGELSAEVFPQIRVLLRDPDPQIRYWATSVLGRMGARALEAREDLEAMTHETERVYRVALGLGS